jgi:hypothetical protein
MAEDNTQAPQATPPAGEPVAATPPTIAPALAATSTPEPLAGDGTEHISLDEARKLRSEAQSLRKRMKAFEDAEQAARDAQLSEVERTKAQHAKLQAEHETYKRASQERLVRYEVAMHAQRLGIIHPDAAAKLLDWSELEYDDDGIPKNADKLLEKLLKQMPYLAHAATPAPAPAPVPQATPAPTTPTIPAMNPGRSSIPSPGLQPGQTQGKFVPVTLNDVFKRQ